MTLTELNNDLLKIITDLELALLIDARDYAIKDINVVIDRVKERINIQYQVDLLNMPIGSTEWALSAQKGSLLLFMGNVLELQNRLSGYCQIARYHTRIDVSLDRVNYLGQTKESMRLVLMALQREKTIASAEKALDVIKLKLASINNCIEKRLFVVMLVAYELQLFELSATLAEILYLGGI